MAHGHAQTVRACWPLVSGPSPSRGQDLGVHVTSRAAFLPDGFPHRVFQQLVAYSHSALCTETTGLPFPAIWAMRKSGYAIWKFLLLNPLYLDNPSIYAVILVFCPDQNFEVFSFHYKNCCNHRMLCLLGRVFNNFFLILIFSTPLHIFYLGVSNLPFLEPSGGLLSK